MRPLLPIALTVALLVGCTSETAPAPTPAVSITSPVASPKQAEPAPVETPPLSSIALTPKETFRDCGENSACFVKFSVMAEMDGPGFILPGQVWRVSYEVTGVREPFAGSFELDDDGYVPPAEIALVMKGAKIRIETTGIELIS